MIKRNRPLLKWIRLISIRWSILWRGLLCWCLACFFLLGDQNDGYDSRFQIRGELLAQNQDVVIITIRPNEIYPPVKTRGFDLDQTEASEATDSYFWDREIWTQMLSQILDQQPKSIGVAFYFNESLGPLALTKKEETLFFDPRVVWAHLAPNIERSSTALLANFNGSNTGSLDLPRDSDGVIRAFAPSPESFPHLIERMTGLRFQKTRVINYKGGTKTFPHFSMNDVIAKRVPSTAFSGKYVLIGPENPSSTRYLGPLGPTSRVALIAQGLENLISKTFVKSAPNPAYFMILLFLEALAILVITQYPHGVALVFLFLVGTAMTTLSIWTFDTFAFWIPISSPLMLLLTTWIVFIGYQANKIERRNWALKQEQIALAELEQLKNNFVSLISHDLKTPIAKMRSVIDRLIKSPNLNPQLEDLQKLESYSDELNRYIQSILKVLRVESRDFKLSLDVGDINETIENVISQVGPLALSKNISLQTKLEPLFTIEADFTLIHEVILNLIENAIKYSPEGSQITIRSSEVDDYVHFEVQDQGPGISESELSSIWGKFVRGKDQDLKSKGSGLGLYLVKYFIELHGGTVGIQSQVGLGTRVFFNLPVEAKGET